MTVSPSSRATATVSSRLQSSTRITSSTDPGGMSWTVNCSVAAALYAGMTATVRYFCGAGSGMNRSMASGAAVAGTLVIGNPDCDSLISCYAADIVRPNGERYR